MPRDFPWYLGCCRGPELSEGRHLRYHGNFPWYLRCLPLRSGTQQQPKYQGKFPWYLRCLPRRPGPQQLLKCHGKFLWYLRPTPPLPCGDGPGRAMAHGPQAMAHGPWPMGMVRGPWAHGPLPVIHGQSPMAVARGHGQGAWPMVCLYNPEKLENNIRIPSPSNLEKSSARSVCIPNFSDRVIPYPDGFGRHARGKTPRKFPYGLEKIENALGQQPPIPEPEAFSFLAICITI